MDGGTGAFAAIGTTFKFIEFCYKLGDVGEENRVFCRLIQRVRDDLDEAFRLMKLPVIQAQWQNDPREKDYVEGTVRSVRLALDGIGRFVESVRVDEERNGTIGLYNRFEWVLRHQAKLATRQSELDTSHKSLLQSISSMKLAQHMTPVLPSYGDATAIRETDDGLDSILTARKRRMTRTVDKKAENLIDLEERPLEKFPPFEPWTSETQQPATRTLQVSPNVASSTQRKSASAYFELSSVSPPSWTASPSIYSEPQVVQTSAPVEMGINFTRSSVPELQCFPATPQIPPQSCDLSRVSTMSDLTNCLSPTYTESSFFPSAPPTPFFPPARPHSSDEGRQRALSAVSSSRGIDRSTTPTPSSPPTRKPLSHTTRMEAIENWSSTDPAANAPEVAYTSPPLPPRPRPEPPNQQQNWHQFQTHPQPSYNRVYDNTLPEVVTAEHQEMRQGSLPEVVPEFQLTSMHLGTSGSDPGISLSATQQQRERRKARLKMISD